MLKRFTAVLAALSFAVAAQAQTMPYEFTDGKPVTGYYNDFSSPDLTGWDWYGTTGTAAVTSEGTLQLSYSGTNDLVHFLYTDPVNDYSNAAWQEVLIRIRVNGTPANDARAGATVYGNNNSDSRGINLLLYRTAHSQNSTGILNDRVAWYKGNPNAVLDSWDEDQWYWLRVRREMGDNNTGGIVYGSCWLDGTPEPAWMYTWENDPQATSGRNVGLAGFACASNASLEVDCILIKAPNLPSIMVPEPATMSLLAMGGLALLRRRK